MAVKFNPFTGQLQIDEKGSGGGSSYIDGEVQNFSALPETLGTPAVDSAYLVREAEGTWLLNRKPAGIYIRTANTGTRASDWTYAGEFPDVFNDANLVVYSNGDSSKNLAFNVGGITTGTTRTLTAPDADGTIARTEDFAAPPATGSTTPNSGAFTTLNATGTTELVNGTNAAGPFRVYNTSSSANANFERGFLRWSSNVLQIGTEKGGTGSARALHFTTDGTARLEISANSNVLQVQAGTFFTIAGATWMKATSAVEVEINNLYPRVNSTTVIGATTRRFATVFADNLNLAPSASVTPANNGELVIEATDNTTLTFKYKGSDGTVRSGTVALS